CAHAQTVAITPVSLDHEEYLGDTIEEIAWEKAAIIRRGVTAVISAQSEAVREVILRQCQLNDVTAQFDDAKTVIQSVSADGRFCVTFESPSERYENVCLGLRGRHQVVNASLAAAIAESLRNSGFKIPRAAIVEGITTAEHPGRLELI